MGIFVIILILVTAVICLSWRLFLLRRSMKKAAQELAQITEELEENRIVRLPAPQREMEELLDAVNQNLNEIRAQRRAYRAKERQLREQVENISHDLRTPLTAILGYLKMIDTQRLTDRDREYLAVAVRKSHTLEKLISQFYELSRVTSEDFSLNVAELDGKRLLKECVLEQYALFEKAEKELRLTLPEQPFFVYADKEAFERIITNLLQNGIRYAKRTLDVSVCPDVGESRIRFVFQNDIEPSQTPEDPERLFDRFYMQEQSRSRGGSGLGLTISRHLAEGMGGTLNAEYTKSVEEDEAPGASHTDAERGSALNGVHTDAETGRYLTLTLTLRGKADE